LKVDKDRLLCLADAGRAFLEDGSAQVNTYPLHVVNL